MTIFNFCDKITNSSYGLTINDCGYIMKSLLNSNILFKFIPSILSKFILSFVASVFLCFSVITPTAARWATLDDVDVSFECYNRTIEVQKSGAHTEIVELKAKILKESGKDKMVSVPLVYNSGSSKLKVIQAKTIKDDKEFPVDLKHIEDKPMASNTQGFDQNNQVLIAFPELSVGAEIYLKYKLIMSEPVVPGFYGAQFIYGSDHFKTSKVKVISEKPFFVQVNDPEHYLDVQKSQANHKYIMDVLLKKPILKMATDEEFLVKDNRMYPWVSISTLDNWSKLGALMSPRYERVLNQKLPALYEKIAKEAEQKTKLIDKINIVTSRLSENITYMGDWRTVEGAYVPRNLAEIVSSKIGDCKDFSASTVAILRRIKVKADAAVVYRGIENDEPPNSLPNPYNFNHAFVRVMDGDKVLWIDPTNFTSFAQGIYPDVADRSALVLDPKNPGLMQTAKLKPEDSVMKLVKKVILPKNEPELAHVEGQVFMSGTHALPLIGADLRLSKESINHDIIRAVTDVNRTVDWKVGDYNLTSRIAHDLNFKFNFTEKHTKVKTTTGNAFILGSQFLINKLLTKTNDRVMGLDLELPGTYRQETLLSKTAMVGTISNCSFESPWVKGSRTVTNTKEGIRVLDELIVSKDKILNADLKTKEYADLQNKVYTCFGETALVYKNE